MREEIFLEVVDEADGLLEHLFRDGTAHEDGLSTKHLGYLGKDGCAALLLAEPVGEGSQKGIGGDARESVGTAALEAYTQFADGYGNTLVGLCLSVKFLDDTYTNFYLVALYLLTNHEADALAVVVAQHLLELLGLIVLAT